MQTPSTQPIPSLGNFFLLLSGWKSTSKTLGSFPSNLIKCLCSGWLLLSLAMSLGAQNNPAPFIGTNLSRGTQILELRLAVSCPGEYTQQVGGVANAKAYINTWLEELNETYGREYCIRFKLIPNNDLLIFANPATDPWPDKAAGGGCNGSAPFGNGVQEQVISNIIGSTNYDFSHIFYSDAMAGGCGGGFQFGVSGPPDIPITRHEMGHQFNQQHTIENGGNNNYELRNGNWSIQGGNQQPYAHGASFHQLAERAQIAENQNVGTKIPTGNTIPTVSAGPDRAIPISTPFTLKGTAADPNPGDQLTYVWDQLDRGIYQESPVADDTQGPLFMRFLPSPNPSRTIPKISDVIAGNYSTTQEHLPTQARDMNIRLTVNDNHRYNLNGKLVSASGINSDDLKITVVNTGPFSVTAPNNGTEVWTTNNQVTVNWAVAGTNNAPISCAAVEIRLSVDGGLNYPYLLVDNTPNDGTQTFLLPEGITATNQARIKVECDSYDNVRFFDISNQNFTINSSCMAFGGLIVPAAPVAANAGDAALNLNLNPVFNSIPEVITFVVDGNDPMGDFAEFDATNNFVCKEGFALNYNTYRIQVDKTGKYTILPKFVGGLYNGFFTLYAGNYDPNNSCTNFVTSNNTAGVGGTAQTETIPDVMLTAGVTYTMVIQPWFKPSATCNVSFSSIDGGKVFPADGATPPDGSYAYSYAAVNKANGIIAAVNSSADFTGLSGGKYEVFGFSYKNTNPPPVVVNPNTFVGKTVSQVLIANCVSFSLNLVPLEVLGAGGGPTCTDGIQNGDETGVDCGGSNCAPCNAGCDLTNAGLTNVACNNNGSGNAAADDYITFNLNPVGTNLGGAYQVSSATATVTKADGSPATNIPYGAATAFRLQNGSAGSGNVVITVTDSGTGSCTVNGTVNDPGSCSGGGGTDDCTGTLSNLVSTDVPKVIPAAGVQNHVITSTINVNVGGVINDVNLLGLNIQHSWVGDLKATLKSPAGTEIILFDHPGAADPNVDAGCSSADLQVAFNDEATAPAGQFENTCNNPAPAIQGSFQPVGALSAFDGENPNGTWTLTITDVFPSEDGGQLQSWSLQLCTSEDVSCNSPKAPPAGGLIAAGKYLTFSRMTTAGQVNAPDNVMLASSTAVVMANGFQVKPGATLRAYIEFCPTFLIEEEEETALSSKEKVEVSAAASLAVEKNQLRIYPNPFQAQTTVVYQLNTSGRVAVEVYNLSGKRIAQPVNGVVLEQGIHELTLDLQSYPPGMYVLLLRTENGVLSKRIASIR